MSMPPRQSRRSRHQIHGIRNLDTFLRNIDWKGVEERYEDAARVEPLRPLEQKEFGDVPGVDPTAVKASGPVKLKA